jgi:hypothetical protein
VLSVPAFKDGAAARQRARATTEIACWAGLRVALSKICCSYIFRSLLCTIAGLLQLLEEKSLSLRGVNNRDLSRLWLY